MRVGEFVELCFVNGKDSELRGRVAAKAGSERSRKEVPVRYLNNAKRVYSNVHSTAVVLIYWVITMLLAAWNVIPTNLRRPESRIRDCIGT
jgi:hypothetical protein